VGGLLRYGCACRCGAAVSFAIMLQQLPCRPYCRVYYAILEQSFIMRAVCYAWPSIAYVRTLLTTSASVPWWDRFTDVSIGSDVPNIRCLNRPNSISDTYISIPPWVVTSEAIIVGGQRSNLKITVHKTATFTQPSTLHGMVKFFDGSDFLYPNHNRISVFCTQLMSCRVNVWWLMIYSG